MIEIAEPCGDASEDHERLVTALFDRAEGPDRARQILAERLVAQIPGLLLAETPELTVDLRRTDPLCREGVRELLDGSDELRRRRTDRFHQRPGRGRCQVHPGSAGTLEEPRLEVLPLKLDLRDAADGLDQLEERSGRLATLGHRATQDEGSLRIREATYAPSSPIASFGSARDIGHDERARLAEERGGRQVLELAPPPLVGVDLGWPTVPHQLQRRSRSAYA